MESELRVAQTEFDRQQEITRLLLEGISSTQVGCSAFHKLSLKTLRRMLLCGCLMQPEGKKFLTTYFSRHFQRFG